MNLDNDIHTYLYNEILERKLDNVKTILNHDNLDINKILPGKEMSILHLAAGIEPMNYSEMITELILIHGGNPNKCTNDGLTPLHIACAWGRSNIIHTLLDYGADPFIKDNFKKLPLDYATENGHFETINILLDYFHNCNGYFDSSPSYSLKLDKVIVESEFIKGEYGITEYDLSDCKDDNDFSKSLEQKSETIINDILLKSSDSNNQTRTFSTCKDNTPDSILSISSTQNHKSDNPLNSNISKSSSLYHTCDEIHSFPNSTEDSSGHIIHSLPDSTEDSSDHTNEASDEESLSDVISPLKFTVNENNRLFSVLFDSNDDHGSKETLVFENEKLSCSPLPHKNYCSKTTLNRNKKALIAKKSLHDNNNDIELQLKFPDYLDVSESGPALSITSQLPELNDTRNIIEEYKYEDKQAGIVLVEKRLLSIASIAKSEMFNKSPSVSRTSSVSSLPLSVDYDTDHLRKELVNLGVNPGPITTSTKKVYLKKLCRLKKENPTTVTNIDKTKNKVYSIELEKSLRDFTWTLNLSPYIELEKKMIKQFEEPDPRKRWREGIIKSSFTYLLLDPRFTNDLPNKVDKMDKKDLWRLFLDSIFYVGKGKRSRPYSHLYQAVSFHNAGKFTSQDKKIQHILDIWKSNLGVVCLHIFQNVIPAEAYTREAAMIEVLGLKNLKNMKTGNYYGIASTWSLKEKKSLGLYLLYRAMLIFLNEGERQLRPVDIC